MLIGARLAQFFQKTPASLSSRRVAARTHIINRRRHLGLGMSTSDSRQHTYIAAIDQGTSSTRVILYNALGENVVSHQVPLNLITPSPGWVEQDANEIIETIKQCMREVVKLASEHGFALSATNIRAIGVTNQRETTVVWDRISGKPLYNTIGTFKPTIGTQTNTSYFHAVSCPSLLFPLPQPLLLPSLLSRDEI